MPTPENCVRVGCSRELPHLLLTRCRLNKCCRHTAAEARDGSQVRMIKVDVARVVPTLFGAVRTARGGWRGIPCDFPAKFPAEGVLFAGEVSCRKVLQSKQM